MWIRKKSKARHQYYYFNTETHESTWKKPREGLELFHILIRHEESRRPNTALTKSDAFSTCQKIYNDLNADFSEELFMEKAKTHSECSSAKRGGQLGLVVGNEMVREFERAAFKLGKGEMTGPAETECGYHIIYRKS